MTSRRSATRRDGPSTSSVAPGRVGEDLLAEAIEGLKADVDAKRRSDAALLVDLALEKVSEFFHTSDGRFFACVAGQGGAGVLELRKGEFRSRLASWFYESCERPAGSQAIQGALELLQGRARFEGLERDVHVRLAELSGVIYLDLADGAGRVAKIDADDWRIVEACSVMFDRPRGLAALPVPVRGWRLDELRPFVNVEAVEWPLFVGFLLACFSPWGPYPLLVLVAEQGSGKSVLARLIKELVDPNEAPLRSAPRTMRDLMISASHSRVLAFDNLSSLRVELSDALCRLSTGGGFATRELYADSEEVIFQAMRPVVLNGIDDVVTRADLVDRSVILSLPRIREGTRRTERELLAAFEEVRPRVLGALLTAVSAALKNLASVSLPSKPRLADFAEWVTAGEVALGLEPGEFLRAYQANRAGAHALALESSPVTGVLKSFVEKVGLWEGKAGELLEQLERLAGESVREGKLWPKSPSSFSNQLRRLAPNLREVGYEVEFNRTSSRRLVRIALKNAVIAVTPSFEGDGGGPGRRSDDDGVDDAALGADAGPSWREVRSGAKRHRDDGDDGVLRARSDVSEEGA